ncbi:RHS repeat domain-containing protein [Sphingomonas sp.]|uniref:RHS repeat protein n=1 Tax=Sphingomonas sp. TaxID=28214 RepID=UPI003F7159AF
MKSALCLSVSLTGLVLASPAMAKDPVNQCTEPGQQMASGASFSAQTQSMSSGEDRPDGLIYPEQPKFQALLPKAAPTIDLGKVNLKTGAYSFSSQDISIGLGEFPARLHIDRTYDSSTADSAPDQIENPRFGPGASDVKYFGIGSTHNLDIRFRSGFESFGTTTGPAYKMIYVSVGMGTYAFQKCANGQFVSSKQDGATLTRIPLVPNSPPDGDRPGYRMVLGDGTRIYLFSADEGVLPGAYRDVCTSPNDDYSQSECGWATRWEAPNGDWATFSYQKYYDRPDGPINAHLQTDHRVDSYDSSQQVCITTALGVQDCREVSSTYSHYHESLSEGLEVRTNQAMYSYRLTQVMNGRDLSLSFSYVDQSVDAGGYCPHIEYDPYGAPNVHCVLPEKNTSRSRIQVSSIKAYHSNVLSKQVSYEYAGLNGNALGAFIDAAGAKTKYELPDANQVNLATHSLKIFLPVDHQNPAVTVEMVLTNGAYFQHMPVGIWQSGFAPHDYRKYPRAVRQTYADGRVIDYQATIVKKWRSQSQALFGYTTPVTYWTPVDYIRKMLVIEAGGVTTTQVFDDEDAPIRVTDPLLNLTENTYDDFGRLKTTKLPEGNSVTLTYDARGNVVQKVTSPKPGSLLDPLTESTTYVGGPTLRAEACSNQVTCNKPTATTDARNATRTYTWDTTTGVMLSTTGPADQNGNQPLTTYGYSPFSAPAGGTVTLLTSETVAIAPGQSVTTSFGYDTANRLFPKEVTVSDGAQTLRSCMRISSDGTPISETAARANLPACP